MNRLFLIGIFTLGLNADFFNQTNEKNIYELRCIPCHQHRPYDLKKVYMLYLKTFSGETIFKASLKAFLKEPMEETSVMPDEWIDDFSVKSKTLLSDEELDKAIDIYWKLYDVRNKLH
jgi:hypothetical protein